jgi:hypothetical protein
MEKKETIHSQTCLFVHASDLFRGLNKLWDEFVDSAPPFSWGDNNRSLVDADSILNHLDGCSHVTDSLVTELRKRVDLLPKGGLTYIDLEN